MKTLKNLFLEELADRYDSEKQLVEAMPKMVAAATCNELKELITSHLKQTEKHVTKIETIFKAFDEKAHAKRCEGTVGLLKEATEVITSFKGTPAINAAIVSAAQKVEHYEIASYGCLHEWAMELKNDAAAGIIKTILDEEGEANKSFIKLARTLCNKQALNEESHKNHSYGIKEVGKAAHTAGL